MKHIVLVAALAALVTIEARSQVTQPNPPASSSQSSRTSTNQSSSSQDPVMPYFSQSTYNAVENTALPPEVTSSFGTKYAGVTGTKWESNNDVYRSSFQQDGKNMSVIYDKTGKMREVRTGTTLTELPSSVQTALNGKNATFPYLIKVNDQTFYSAQVNGQDVYFDSAGNSINVSGQPRK